MARTFLSALLLLDALFASGCRSSDASEPSPPKPVGESIPDRFQGSSEWPAAGDVVLAGPWTLEVTLVQNAVGGPPVRLEARLVGETAVDGTVTVKERETQPATLAKETTDWPQSLLKQLRSAASLAAWLKQSFALPSNCRPAQTAEPQVQYTSKDGAFRFRGHVGTRQILDGWAQTMTESPLQGQLSLLRETRLTGDGCEIQQIERYRVTWGDGTP